MFPTVADPPYNLGVTTQGSTVTVTWSNGNGVAGHRVLLSPTLCSSCVMLKLMRIERQ